MLVINSILLAVKLVRQLMVISFNKDYYHSLYSILNFNWLI